MKWTNLFIKFLEITKRFRGLMITNLSDLLQKICTTANPLEVAFVTFWLTPSLPLTSGCPLTIKMQKKNILVKHKHDQVSQIIYIIEKISMSYIITYVNIPYMFIQCMYIPVHTFVHRCSFQRDLQITMQNGCKGGVHKRRLQSGEGGFINFNVLIFL